ncbi:MAG TPA: septum formation initiator family protein [Candidatus Polarisedimenticolia bacterium]|nr:septum formation initiator family protein [Candidatus Polarisedimenticolia bacterium]
MKVSDRLKDPVARARAARWAAGALGGLLAFHLVFGDMGLVAGARQRANLARLGGEAKALGAETEALKREVEGLTKDPFRIEALAREQLGLARPGEIIFLFPDSRETSDPAKAPAR